MSTEIHELYVKNKAGKKLTVSIKQYRLNSDELTPIDKDADAQLEAYDKEIVKVKKAAKKEAEEDQE